MVAYVWYLKWRETHPRKIGELTETDAEITAIRFQSRFLQPKEEDKATVFASYINEKGRKVGAQLATYPVRKQLEFYAPELKPGTKVRIQYEKNHPQTFYFADPRYAAEEVSGQPRHVRISWFGLVLVTLLMFAFLGFLIWLMWYDNK